MFPQSLFDDFRDGRIVLVTGAGVSTSARNRFGRPIIGTAELAATVAAAVDLPYEGEDIKEVFEAARSTISTAKLSKIFFDNFVDTAPGDPLIALFTFPWKRCYTFNVDDTIENIPRHKRIQRISSYNALKDRRVEWQGYDECQVIHLHGTAREITDGLIFSSTDYADAASRNPAWYLQLGEDFIDYTVLFLGTSLNENILFQTIRSALTKDVNPGRSFCITPGKLSAIKSKALEARGISHIEGTLENLITELRRHFPDGFGPRDVQSSGSAAGGALRARFTDRDVEALRSIFPISQKSLNERFPVKKTDLNKHRRRFYEGYGATWPVIYSDSYAKLGQFAELSISLNRIRQSTKIAVVLGEAGAGKSTFVMHYGL